MSKRSKSAFTLIELLVVIVIIVTLAAISLQVYVLAAEKARHSRTEAVIAIIEEVLAMQLESYTTRRLDAVNTTPQGLINARRELLKLELPDRITDIVDAIDSTGNYVQAPPDFLNSRPRLSLTYMSKVRIRKSISGKVWTPEHQSSECLALILSSIFIDDTPAREFLRETDFADTDGDALQEVVDGWGTPITFMRWAPGFLPPHSTVQQTNTTGNGGWDLTDIHKYDYPLIPLVVSHGADKKLGLETNASTVYRNTTPKNSPFFAYPFTGEPLAGTDHHDNIHNH